MKKDISGQKTWLSFSEKENASGRCSSKMKDTSWKYSPTRGISVEPEKTAL